MGVGRNVINTAKNGIPNIISINKAASIARRECPTKKIGSTLCSSSRIYEPGKELTEGVKPRKYIVEKWWINITPQSI